MMMTPEDFEKFTAVCLTAAGLVYAHPFALMVFDFLNQRGAFH